jgi:hypothetical protein
MPADAYCWPQVASQSNRILPHCGQTIQVKGNGLFGGTLTARILVG